MTSKKNLLPQRRNGAAENAKPVSVAPLRRRVGNFLAIACVCGLMLFAACSKSTTTTNTPVISNPPTGTTYPMPPTGTAASLANMGWQLADGNHSVFSEYKGKVLILDFYATWCGPCRDSIPHLIGLQKKYEDQGLQVVGLNVGGPGDEQRVPAFAEKFGIQYPLAQPDEDLVVLLLADQNAIPQTFVFDRQGQLVQRFVGFGPSTGIYLDGAVETALKSTAN
ncbi:MAG TPA: TlpA disulfide reductase family protein [Pyrinomonadaceae bacterium]|jgi:thiol-disulfide isomerase/thioredoxin|nr:TlpA disulfide reductase family protein [Pyrinomonadaceae bacterium]